MGTRLLPAGPFQFIIHYCPILVRYMALLTDFIANHTTNTHAATYRVVIRGHI